MYNLIFFPIVPRLAYDTSMCSGNAKYGCIEHVTDN